MSALNDENSESVSKVHQVRQAATMLGISERTVYRRLRSGKLEQLPTESQSTDSVMSIVSDQRLEMIFQDHITSRLDKMSCQNDMTNDNLAALRQEMAQKDVQIRTLLESQEELRGTIQKLQAQIFELARLALLQSSRSEVTDNVPVAAASCQDSDPTASGNRLTRWLHSLGRRR